MALDIAATETQTQLSLGLENEFEDLETTGNPAEWFDKEIQKYLSKWKLFGKPIREFPELIIAGGVFSSIYTGGRIKDVDVYLARSATKDFYDKYKFAWDGKFRNQHWYPVQFITMIDFQSPQELLETFDFSVTRIAYHIGSNTYHTSDNALDDLYNRRLNLIKRNAPVDLQMERIARYVKKGFKPTKESFECLHNTWDDDLTAPWMMEYEEQQKVKLNQLQADFFALGQPPQEQNNGILGRVWNALAERQNDPEIRGVNPNF